MEHRRDHDPVERLNDHHADDLLAVARAFGGHTDATSARVEHLDRDGIDLSIDTPSGPATARVSFAETVTETSRRSLRAAFKELARRAEASLAAGGSRPSTS